MLNAILKGIIIMSRKFSILGHPLKHTMSPPIHAKLFEMVGKDGEYIISDIAPKDLKEHVKELNTLTGYNVTIPHKVSIIPYLDKLDVSAIRYGAVNCVSNVNGVTTGYNTDCYGFLRALQIGGANLKGNVLQLGCGGVGRMMAIETALQGGTLTIAVRPGFEHETETVLEEIKHNAPKTLVKVTTLDKIEGSYDLLINATPVGMFPHIDACPVSDEVIKNCSCVFDAVYNPVKTLLMQKADGLGKKTIGGMAMLVWQAVVAHEIWDASAYESKDIAEIIFHMEQHVTENF